MGIKNLHSTIDYKKLIELQAQEKVTRINPLDSKSSGKNKVMIKKHNQNKGRGNS